MQKILSLCHKLEFNRKEAGDQFDSRCHFSRIVFSGERECVALNFCAF